MDLATIKQKIESSAAGDWQIEQRGETQVAFLKSDVALRIETTLDGLDVQAKPFNESWATSHSDPKAAGCIFNVYYGATLVSREILVSIDGGRALIPLPDTKKMSITPYQYALGQIYSSHGQLDDYLKRCRLSVS